MNYKDRYKKYRKEVQEQMKIIIDNSNIEEGYVTVLDLLAINYDMLYKSIDSINENGIEREGVKDRTIKNHAIQTFNTAQQTIIKLLNSFPSNPLSKAKIKKLSEVDDSEDLLDELTK